VVKKIVIFFFGLAGLLPITVQAERARTAIPRATLNYLSLQVAETKGFFRSEGLEHETVVIAGTTAVAALLSGDVDYSGAGGSGMRAAVNGAPIKAIMFQTEKVSWYLVTAPEVSKISHLKGKKIGVGTIGDTQDTLITMLIEREGLSARDVTRIAMPARNTTMTLLGLKTGAIHAATMNGDEALLAEKEGLNTLTFLGDLFPYPFQGFLATDRKIAERPAEIKRWLRAVIRALLFIRERPEEAADIAIKKLPLRSMSRTMLVDGIRRFVRALPEGTPGLPSQQGIKNVIEFDVKSPLKIKEDIAPERFLNLRLVAEVKEELEGKR
jgi:ABC-type nitrate/sulfonate/bicarbonate transport system substrate-binding protein